MNLADSNGVTHSPASCKNSYPARVLYIDALKVVSIFMVILIHTTCNIYAVFSDSWWQYYFLSCLPVFAVPCFFMCSGALVLCKSEPVLVFLRKRVLKLVICLFFYSTLYIFFRKYILSEDIVLSRQVLSIWREQKFHHLWFMYPLISLYLITPFLQILLQKATLEIKKYFVVLMIVVPTIFISLHLVLYAQYTWMPSLYWIFPALGYFVLGYLLHNDLYGYIAGKYKHAVAGALHGLFFVLAITYWSTLYQQKAPSKLYMSADQLPVLIYSVAVFILFQSLENVLEKLSLLVKKGIASVAKVTMGIYALYPLLMHYIGNIDLGFIRATNNLGSGLEILLGTFVYFIASWMLSLGLSKIRYVRVLV